MTLRHKSKINKVRGKRSHGRGKAKRGRGRGSRMGRASVKRGQRNIQHILKYEPERLHQKGFHSLKKKLKTINLSEVVLISEKENKTNLNFKNKKILGKGKLTKKLTITAKAFTQKAKEKITKIGGQAIVTHEEQIPSLLEAKSSKGEKFGSKGIKTNN